MASAHIAIKSIRIGDKIFNIGDKFRAKSCLKKDGPIRPSEVVSLAVVKISPDSRELLGLYSTNYHDSPWTSLEGAVPGGHGLWVDRDTFLKMFEITGEDTVVIRRDFNFKNRNLKGMKGRLINKNPTRDGYFVELETDVGGGSADGMCGAGRCVVLPEHILDWQQEIENKVIPLPENVGVDVWDGPVSVEAEIESVDLSDEIPESYEDCTMKKLKAKKSLKSLIETPFLSKKIIPGERIKIKMDLPSFGDSLEFQKFEQEYEPTSQKESILLKEGMEWSPTLEEYVVPLKKKIT